MSRTPRGGRDIDHLGLFGVSGMRTTDHLRAEAAELTGRNDRLLCALVAQRRLRSDLTPGHLRYWTAERRGDGRDLRRGGISRSRTSLAVSSPSADRQIATQIALAHPKCKVVAIAGSADKCAKLKEMGCHAVINYKDQGWQKQLKQVGLVDVYFDNGPSSAPAQATVL